MLKCSCLIPLFQTLQQLWDAAWLVSEPVSFTSNCTASRLVRNINLSWPSLEICYIWATFRYSHAATFAIVYLILLHIWVVEFCSAFKEQAARSQRFPRFRFGVRSRYYVWPQQHGPVLNHPLKENLILWICTECFQSSFQLYRTGLYLPKCLENPLQLLLHLQGLFPCYVNFSGL